MHDELVIQELTKPTLRLLARQLESSIFKTQARRDCKCPLYGALYNGMLVGASRLNLNPLKGYYGQTLALLKELNPEVAIAATFVVPTHQDKGIAKTLRSKLQKQYKRILTSTGPKSDPAMTHLNHIQGFQKILEMKRGTVVWFWTNDYPKFVRAGGNAVCEICHRKYFDHPQNTDYLDWNGYPYLNVLCDGTLVKL
jgi:hypothetical protein